MEAVGLRSAEAEGFATVELAREALLKECGPIGKSRFKDLNGSATITGVAFFDVIHGQRGVAPNGIELHPALSFSGSCS